ncbi:MAG: hydroxymethylbilane synthase, partial [Deltaproteobacteria bacterium]
GQGALGIEIRAGDERVERLLAPLHDRNTASCVGSERALLAALGGGCQTPIGAYARLLPDGEIHLSGLVASPDGKRLIRGEARGQVPEEVGRRLATDLLDRGGRALLASIP